VKTTMTVEAREVAETDGRGGRDGVGADVDGAEVEREVTAVKARGRM
jgi:hypothetical protein